MQVTVVAVARDPRADLERLVAAAGEPGLLLVRLADGGGAALSAGELEPLRRSRAVTVAEVRGRIAGGTLEVALGCDLVYLTEGAVLELPAAGDTPPPGLLWAAGRAGRAALARVLLDPAPVAAAEAVELGLADGLLGAEEDPPLPLEGSVAALTAARDLVRARGRGRAGDALELASFRLVLATGDPAEGARAFLERRDPEF